MMGPSGAHGRSMLCESPLLLALITASEPVAEQGCKDVPFAQFQTIFACRWCVSTLRMTPSFPSIALSEENCIAPLDSKVKTLRTHACPYLCRLAYRRKPSWVTACRHRPLRTVYISGCWRSTRAQPRHGRGPCGVAAGELHSSTGFGGGNGMCWVLGATVHTDRLSYYTPPLYPYIYTVVRPTVSVRSTSVPRTHRV